MRVFVFTGQNEDIQTWPDSNGNRSWTGRFIDYLKAHGKLSELAFFSVEHYPVDPGKITWSSLYDEAQLVTHIMKVWREDGVPAEVPLLITESNLCSQPSEAYMDIWGALWLADYIGAFLSAGGNAVYYFHYLPSRDGTRLSRLTWNVRLLLRRPQSRDQAATLAIFREPHDQPGVAAAGRWQASLVCRNRQR